MQDYLPIQNRLTPDIQFEEQFIQLSSGNKIHVDVYMPSKPKATIVLLHGVGGNGRLLSFLAVPLYQSGYKVICPDLPLYGYSEYSGTVTYQTWVSDALEITQLMIAEGLPVFLFGLSAGGMLAYQVACKAPLVKGVLTTCILDQRQRSVTEATACNPMLVRFGLPVMNLASKLLPNIKLPMKWVANMKAIVNNQPLAKLLMADKRSSGASISLAFLVTMLNPAIDTEPEQFKQPFLLVHPEDDQWTDVSLSRLFYDRLAGEKQLHLLAGAGHFPIEKTGLKELGQKSIAFIEAHRA